MALREAGSAWCMKVHILGAWMCDKARGETHFRVQLVDAANCLLDATVFDCLTNLHPLLDRVLVDRRGDACLASKLDRGVRESLHDEVVEHECIEIAAR